MKRLNKSKKPGMFDIIAPVYDLFYNHQKKKFRVYLDQISDEWGLNFYPKIIDIGCGTGALASVLNELGHDVTAVDASPRMLLMGEKRPENSNIHFLRIVRRYSITLSSTVNCPHSLRGENSVYLIIKLPRTESVGC